MFVPRSILLAGLLAGLVVHEVSAQVRPGVFGYQVRGTGGTAGEFCLLFDCTPRPLSAIAGEMLTLQVNAPLNALFAIGASFTATNCLPIPGVANALVLDPPVFTLVVGTISQSSPILACWGGFQLTPLPLPPGLPVGFSFATQALAMVPGLGGPSPAFSVAVVTTIR